jgi:hypothetical protein
MNHLYLLLTNEEKMLDILPLIILVVIILSIFFTIKCLPTKNTNKSNNKYYSPKP